MTAAWCAAATPLRAQPANTTHAQPADTVHTSSNERTRLLVLLGTPLVVAGGAQLLGTPKAWPRTPAGYSYRLGDQFGFLAVEEAVRHGVGALLPWSEDERPCIEGRPGRAREFASRLACAVDRTNSLRSSSGARRPNLPFITANIVATSASLAWRPERSNAVTARSFVAQRLVIVYGATVVARLVNDWYDDSRGPRARR